MDNSKTNYIENNKIGDVPLSSIFRDKILFDLFMDHVESEFAIRMYSQFVNI